MKTKLNSSGFTLIEVILSIAILGIILIGFISMFSGGAIIVFNAGHKSTQNVKAQSIIDRVYEETKAKDLSQLKTEIDKILDETLGSGNYVDYTSNISNFDEPYSTNNKYARYYIENEVFVSGETYPVFVFRMYYQNGRRFNTIKSPLSK